MKLEELCESGENARVKIVCVATDVGESIKQMGEKIRDQVVMVRVDEETCRKLDSWVETGIVKSRSEAAAMFIREGLGVRTAELERLEKALGDVESAKDRLREQARKVLGEGTAKP